MILKPKNLFAGVSAFASALLPTGMLLAQEATEQATEAVQKVVPGSALDSLTGPALRMILSLAVVLVVLFVVAWLARKLRGSQLQGGMIQIVSGLSLGPKDRVVLLRVGNEEVLVGLSPAGMRSLHVMEKPIGAEKFSLNMGSKT